LRNALRRVNQDRPNLKREEELMNTNQKPKSVEPAQQVRDLAEKSTERSKEFYENAGATTTEAAAALQSCWLNAFRDYLLVSGVMATTPNGDKTFTQVLTLYPVEQLKASDPVLRNPK
jgi:hypothetical protein